MFTLECSVFSHSVNLSSHRSDTLVCHRSDFPLKIDADAEVFHPMDMENVCGLVECSEVDDRALWRRPTPGNRSEYLLRSDIIQYSRYFLGCFGPFVST